MSIEKNYNISFVADLALREKQIQQNYRPIIAVHKWFARRPGTLFRSLLLSEFIDKPIAESFYHPADMPHLTIGDPFMGGGTPLIEANRIGCDVVGYDINPMAYWIVKEELEYLDIEEYLMIAHELRVFLQKEIGFLHETKCVKCSANAPVKYFLWIKTIECENCSSVFDLSPGYLIAENKRHPMYVVVCKNCGELNEISDKKNAGFCRSCTSPLSLTGNVLRRVAVCPQCGKQNVFPRQNSKAPSHRLFAMEYHCFFCKSHHAGRFFKKPDKEDLEKTVDAENRLISLKSRFIPDDVILPGDETDRLLRWGYQHYFEMFNKRQLLGLELSGRFISGVSNQRIRHALATNLSDLLRYQNMLCRYDPMALKSLDIFSIHGFPIGLIQCESNLLGIPNGGGNNVGSGGWSNIIEKFQRAKSYCTNPFEIRHYGGRKVIVPIVREWIGDTKPGERADRQIDLHCENAMKAELQPHTLDAVFTDPPYFGNVQYAELMDFCYVWLKKIVGDDVREFQTKSTRNEAELTGNVNMGRDLEHFASGLANTLQNFAAALKPGRPFAFTFHHNQLDAYIPVVIAVLEADLVCTAVLPCPAEMGASIHINGTKSAITDSVFVCRSTGTISKRFLACTSRDIAGYVANDYEKLLNVYNPSQGDIRCILYGHLARLAIWHLREFWLKSSTTQEKILAVRTFFQKLSVPVILETLEPLIGKSPERQFWQAMEKSSEFGGDSFEISF